MTCYRSFIQWPRSLLWSRPDKGAVTLTVTETNFKKVYHVALTGQFQRLFIEDVIYTHPYHKNKIAKHTLAFFPSSE